jgi:hypothetical protein
MDPALDLNAEQFYEHPPRADANVAHGDLFADVLFSCASAAGVLGQAETYELARLTATGVVCSHPEGFLARPHGVRAYAHPYRLMAPLLTFDELAQRGVEGKTLEVLRERRRGHGYMYAPHPVTAEPAAVCLFRMGLVHQNLLDRLPRIGRFSDRARRILACQAIEVISPFLFDPGAHELTHAWSDPAWDPPEDGIEL